MNISSVVIRAHPQGLADLSARLSAMPGVEVHGENPEGRLVITLEDTDVTRAADAYVALHDVPGVLCATLVYQYGDDELPSPPPSAFSANQEEVMP